MQSSIFNQTNTDGPDTAEGFHNIISKMTGGLNPTIDDTPPTFEIFSKSNKPIKKEYDSSLGTPAIYLGCVNGTWDLVLSLTTTNDNFQSTATPRSKRYEYGEIRRTMITEGKSGFIAQEIFPALFGLTTIKITHDLILTPGRTEIIFTGSQLVKSSAPWQKSRQSSQALEVCISYMC